MPTIDLRLWRPLFDAVYEINTATDHADFLTALVAGMSRLIPADLIVAHLLDRKSQRLAFRMYPENPYSEEEVAYYVANPGGNPLVAHYEKTGETKALRVSDVISRKEWLRTPHFVHCDQRLGFVHFLALPVKIDADTVGALSFNRRGANFTKRHCALLDAFAPHFVLAWNRHPDPWTESPDPGDSVRLRLQKLGLTARESDVLYWMTEGKQNREIATIIGRSLNTVQEHVANIIAKLGQENRSAAVVHAIRKLGLS